MSLDKELMIYTFGSFRVMKNGKSISSASGRSKKMWDLFKIFITTRGKRLSVLDCYEAVWGEEDRSSNPSGALQNLIYRLRMAVGDPDHKDRSSFIGFIDNSYFWNCDSSYWLDSQVFEELIQEAQAVRGKEPDRAIALYQRAIDLYQGEYLPEFIYNNWVEVSRNRYSRIFTECGETLAGLLKRAKRYTEILNLCEKVFSFDALNDVFHALYIETLFDMGKIIQAQSHYRYITMLFYRKIGIAPTEIIKEAYNKIKEYSGLKHAALEQVQEELRETADEAAGTGALFCDFEAFRSVYRLACRKMPHTEVQQFLCLATIEHKAGLRASKSELQEAVEIMIKVAEQRFNATDVISKWSEEQLIFLLTFVSADEKDSALLRLEEIFNKRNLNENIAVQLECMAIMPTEQLSPSFNIWTTAKEFV